MPIIRWEPLRDLVALQERMNRLFEERLGRTQGEDNLTAAFAPPVDIYEDEHEIVLEVDVPGLDQKDLDVRIENNTLTIRGERKMQTEVKEENFHRVERAYGSFARSFTVPPTVNAEQIAASYTNGVLRLVLAKREETRPKQIKVQIGEGKANAA